MNKRELRLEKYGISGKRYKELCGFCEQYPDWKRELRDYSFIPAGKKEPGMPKNPNGGLADNTGKAAMRVMELNRKCDLIERVAKEASEDCYEYILKSVCGEVPVNYLISFEEMPCGKSAFYEMRRYFFYLLDKEKD